MQRIAGQAVGKAVRSQQPKSIEPGVYPVVLEPQAVSDLMGFLANSFDARTADEGRSAFSAKDGKTRVGETLFNQRINLYSDPEARGPPGGAGDRRGHSRDAAVARQARRARESPVLAVLGAVSASASRHRDR